MSLWKWNDVELEIDMEDYDLVCHAGQNKVHHTVAAREGDRSHCALGHQLGELPFFILCPYTIVF